MKSTPEILRSLNTFDPNYQNVVLEPANIVIEYSEYEIDGDETYYPTISVYVVDNFADMKPIYVIEEQRFKTNDALWEVIHTHLTRAKSQRHKVLMV